VGKEGQPLDSVNFRSDDKRTKRAARVMMHMVMHINEEHLADVPDRPMPHVVVKCETCHRGVARPRPLDDDLALMLADSGLDATVRRYRALRDQYYGSGSYDFREITLNLLAGSEARAGRADNAIALLKLNAEFNANSTQIPFQLGDIFLQRGDTAAALAEFKESLAKDSTNGAARRRLQALGGAQRP
jgi:Photosynthetic reaction centre cytochrome C subunit